ncbi:TylF/MycF/NovP-related O-methyltransferase [Halorarum salinum]|uniref:Class I SAM-dependent methyltransferase n=1 Tax=Halorarum salinum TaxID=2743089 RepID=A0A7D5QA36_9EURY|nr:TylF/MycF/NovP-related O-methyltransferase [Halobaculum salinum]QLG61119.1 class I SAM-dependent methyltransferase [Halobaculum salinum]
MTEKTELAFAKLYRLYRLGVVVLSAPIVLADYFGRETGAQYGVGLPRKLLFAVRMARNNGRIPTGSTFLEHLVVATRILELPAEAEGPIVECGCYKGGSTANLSLVAGACDRELHVFDSFEGMPAPSERDEEHLLVESEQVHTYAENSWRASIEEVRDNVAEYGDATACTFHEGYFEDTLPEFEEGCALAFLDVGLRDSAETCVEHLWPRLADGGHLFTHDVKHMEISALFFDSPWWRETVGCEAPGLVGAGNGLGLHPGSNGFTSLLGYAVKNPDGLEFERVAETGSGNCVDTSFTGGR